MQTKANNFIDSAKQKSTRYVLAYFVLVLTMLFLPVFWVLIHTQPYEMYQRVFSLNFQEAEIKMLLETPFFVEPIMYDQVAIYVFNDYLAFSDGSLLMLAPVHFFNIAEMHYSFEELFSKIAMYNLYIPHLLVPMLLLSFFVLFVLHLFFSIVTAYFLGVLRLHAIKFEFGERLKIIILCSVPVASICTIIGFFIPIVHIIFFQMINLIVIFWLLKKYDEREKKLVEDVI